MNDPKKARLQSELSRNIESIRKLSDHVRKLKKRNADIRKELERG